LSSILNSPKDVPDLREIVIVNRMMRARLEPQDPGVWFGRSAASAR
jgi:hypothetical protein